MKYKVLSRILCGCVYVCLMGFCIIDGSVMDGQVCQTCEYLAKLYVADGNRSIVNELRNSVEASALIGHSLIELGTCDEPPSTLLRNK